MLSSHSSFEAAIVSAWRGQLAATGARRGLRAQLVQHRHELLPRFAARYRHLCALPRHVRKALQRQWRASLAAVALLLTVQPGASAAADFTAGTAAELVAAITTANGTVAADTITLTADITLTTVNNTTYGPTGLPIVSSAITIAGNGHALRRDLTALPFRLVAINAGGNLTVQSTTLRGGGLDRGKQGLSDFGGAILNVNGHQIG